jgi:succinate dehydrogenase/fumarate reductase flavoprotein subunit
MVDLDTFGGDADLRHADVLVMEAGAAGVRAAIELDEMGARAPVVS